MGDSMNGFGLSWEQLLIAGVAFAVLIGVIVAAFRGSGRGKRDRAAAGAGGLAGERRAPREPPSFAASGAGGRAEPSLGRAAAPEPPPTPRPQPAPIRPEPPVALAPEPEPEPVPSFLVPPRPAPLAAGPQASPAADEPDPALEDLKSEVEELRQANAILKRRVEETERTLIDMQTEMQARFASLDRAAAKEELAAKPTPLRPPPPQRFARPAEPAAEKENDLERARRAIELLSRKDEDAS